MDDLIKTLTDKFDFLDVDKAKQVLGTVAGFLGDKLPEPIADQINKFLGADGDDGEGGDDDGDGGGIMDMAKDALGGLGGLLGGDDD